MNISHLIGPKENKLIFPCIPKIQNNFGAELKVKLTWPEIV